MVERAGDELRPIVHPDLGGRAASLEQQPVHDIDHLLALDALIHPDREALAGIGIDNISSLNQRQVVPCSAGIAA